MKRKQVGDEYGVWRRHDLIYRFERSLAAFIILGQLQQPPQQ